MAWFTQSVPVEEEEILSTLSAVAQLPTEVEEACGLRKNVQLVPDQSPRRTRLLRLVPRRKPAPTFCFCRMVPENLRTLPVPGSVTLPVNNPLAVERVSESLLLARLVTRLFKIV